MKLNALLLDTIPESQGSVTRGGGKAKLEASRGPLKAPVSAQKALQGSETETRKLLEEREKNGVITYLPIPPPYLCPP